MSRTTTRAVPTVVTTLMPSWTNCPTCRRKMWADYDNRGTVVGLDGAVRLVLKIRRCRNQDCPRFHKPYRPEAEGRYALPHYEFGLDVVAWVGRLRHAEHRSVPEIHRYLVERGVAVSERTVANLLDRHDELLAVSDTDCESVAIRGYCSAVRSAITDDGRPPLESSGLKLHDRVTKIAGSLAVVASKKGSRNRSKS